MSGRPVSGKTRPYSGTRNSDMVHTLKAQMTDVVSYEDLLVAQYLEELKRSQPLTKTNAKIAASPYLQKLSGSRPSSSHVIPATKRPQSATVTLHMGYKPKIDPKFIADPELWDPATPRDTTRHRSGRSHSAKRRPISAPAYKRPLSSSTYSSSRPGSAKYGSRKTRALYKRQPYTIVVLAFKNGCREAFAKLAAPSIKVLLEMATDKLGLPSAARRVFLDDGTEVFTPREIYREAEVYISCGEPFKDPLKPLKQHSTLTQNCAWTMNGLVWTQDNNKKRTTRPHMSRRFRTLIEQSRRRVLVFKNGQGQNGVEIVADPNRLEDFLVACTAKVELGSYARVLYDWSGHEIHNLEEAPVLDQCLQTWSTPVLGPLWVSKGEGFSPKGVEEFLTGLIKYTRIKLKEAKHYRTQLEYGQHEDTKHQVQIVAILSMTESEIDETIEIVKRDVEDFSNALNRLKEQMDEIRSKLGDETDAGHNYKMKHIQEFDADHPLVGTKGLRLKVYENGTYENETVVYFNLHFATRGVEKDAEKIMARFLDECSASSALSHPKNPQIRAVATKIFNNVGKEIKNIYDLNYDQEIWLSYGEPWKNPFTYVLSAQFDKVRVYDIEYKTENTTRRTGGREQLMGDDVEGQEKANKWEIHQGLPHDFSETMHIADDQGMERESVLNLLQCSEIPVDRLCVMANKEIANLVLFPELVISTKHSKGDKTVWPAEAQTFIVCQNGFIKSKAFAGLCLAVLDFTVKATLNHPTKGPTSTEVEGYLVGFDKKCGQDPSDNQSWVFTKDGLIRPESHPELFLTFMGSEYANEDSMVTNADDSTKRAQGLYLCVAPRIEGKQSRAQRFAFKQERFDILGQWKYTRVENPEWQKRALSWPLNEDGDLNEDYDWPMEAFIMPYAPPLKKREVKSGNAGQAPLRLIVLKNGVRDITKAVPVVGPDLTNMKKDTQNKKKDKKKKDKKEIETEQEEESLSVLKLEFILFLERCTSLLDLPFAARRLFDEMGKEHFSLVNLSRDQLAYVSCGELWTDPTLSKAEQQRRFLLSNLASDVSQIRHFVNLRHADNLVLQVAEGLHAGSALCINDCALNPELDQQEEREAALLAEKQEQNLQENRQMKEEMEALVSSKMSAHDHSHARADERHEKLKWPWERIINRELDGEVDPEEQHYSNKQMYRKFRPKKKREDDGLLELQKFMFVDNRIVCSSDFDLVLGIRDVKGSRGDVVLVKRRPDDIMQCFNMQPNGVITCKYNSSMVLTVAMPNSLGDEEPGSYVGCEVQIQRRRTQQFGRANQRWYYDESTGMLQAFHTVSMDKEITAANRANVCTFAVMGTTEIDQPGHVVETQAEKGAKPKRLLVCSSCARAMRGRHKLEKVTDNVDFACAMGSAKEHGVKHVGSFKCLNGKVDLSTYEAEHTLEEWEGQLDKLKDELSVRAIAKEISAAKVPYTVKVLAYKNGAGRLKPGEQIVSSSTAGILEQAAARLELGQAARRVYMRDGTLVLDVDDIVDWTRQQYCKDARKEMRAERKAEQLATQEKSDGENLMDKVELDSDDASSSESEQEEEDVDNRKRGAAFIASATDGALSGSSVYNANSSYNRSRLNTRGGSGFSGAWCAKSNSVGEYIQADLGVVCKLDTIATQGRQDSDQWVKSYRIIYSRDGSKYLSLKSDDGSEVTFSANSDRDTVVENSIGAIEARYVRLYPLSWNNHMSLRWEVYGHPIEEMVLGYEIQEDRKNMDQIGMTVIVPNPHESVRCDAYIMSWLFHTNSPGRIVLMVVRRGSTEPNHVTVVSMTTFKAENAGEHQVDCSEKPLYAKAGDMIGFLCLDDAMIPFDIEADENEYPLYTMLEEAPAEGHVIPMESWVQQGSRQYSLNAFLVPESAMKRTQEPEVRDAQATRQRPKSAKRGGVPSKKSDGKKNKNAPYVEPPPIDMVLKYPVEVWISCGETFIKPQKVATQHETMVKMREERAQVAFELDKEKHTLRHMKGRRFDKLNPGEFRATSNPAQPVYKHGHWQEPTLDELQKHDEVYQLQSHLTEVKTNQKRKSGIRTCNVKTTRRLYTQPAMKRVLIFANGESIERAQYVWGETLDQLLDNSSVRLDLRKPAKYVFTIEGIHVQDIAELERDQLVCVAPSKHFMLPKEAQQEIEVKANWGRARKRYGPHATDIIVSASKNDSIDVDPFGPSALAGGPTKPRRNAYPSTHKQ